MFAVRIVCLVTILLALVAESTFAATNGSLFPDVALQVRASTESTSFHTLRQNDMAIVYIDFFNAGEPSDAEILAKVNDRAIYQDRPDGPKIRVFAIGSMNSFQDEDRFPVLIDDAFSAPALLDINDYPYVVSVDCQGNIIGQLFFEPPSAPGEPIRSKGLLESGKWEFIQESVQRAVDSGACP